MGAVFTEKRSYKIKKTGLAALLGLASILMIQVVLSFAAAKLLENESALIFMSAASVFIGCAFASFYSGGKIYGVATFVIILLILLISGGAIFKTGLCAESAVVTTCAGAVGTLSGIILRRRGK